MFLQLVVLNQFRKDVFMMRRKIMSVLVSLLLVFGIAVPIVVIAVSGHTDFEYCCIEDCSHNLIDSAVLYDKGFEHCCMDYYHDVLDRSMLNHDILEAVREIFDNIADIRVIETGVMWIPVDGEPEVISDSSYEELAAIGVDLARHAEVTVEFGGITFTPTEGEPINFYTFEEFEMHISALEADIGLIAPYSSRSGWCHHPWLTSRSWRTGGYSSWVIVNLPGGPARVHTCTGHRYMVEDFCPSCGLVHGTWTFTTPGCGDQWWW